MRDLMRSVAKANMRDAGIPRFTKGGIFCRSWRDWVFPDKRTKRRYKKALHEWQKKRKEALAK